VLKRVTKLPAFDSMELDEELNSEVMLKCGKEGAHVSLTYNGRASPTPLWRALALSFSGRPRPAPPKLRSRSRSGSVYSFYPCRAHLFPRRLSRVPFAIWSALHCSSISGHWCWWRPRLACFAGRCQRLLS
jgi:hypothetical protein